MPITQPYCTMVPESGMLTLPSEFRATEVIIHSTTLKSRPSMDGDEFWCSQSLDEIVHEQGGPKICTSPDEYFGSLAFLWDSEEEIETFLKKRKDDV